MEPGKRSKRHRSGRPGVWRVSNRGEDKCSQILEALTSGERAHSNPDLALAVFTTDKAIFLANDPVAKPKFSRTQTGQSPTVYCPWFRTPDRHSHLPIPHRLGNMSRFDDSFPVEVGDGPSDAKYPMVAARRNANSLGGR